MLRVIDLFAGIGGISFGLEKTGGFKTVAFCEIENFPAKVLNKHWPNVPVYKDVKELTNDRLKADGIGCDILTGGFPCQDISKVGNQKGIDAERSGLWSECARLLGEIRPRFALFENVATLLSGDNGKWFERVLFDLSEVGYDAEWHCIPASELGANHHRDRVWLIAYPSSERLQGGTYPRVFKEGWQGFEQYTTGHLCSFESLRNIKPTICRSINGVSNYIHRIKGLGNAVVPQVPELIGYAILEADK